MALTESLSEDFQNPFEQYGFLVEPIQTANGLGLRVGAPGEARPYFLDIAPADLHRALDEYGFIVFDNHKMELSQVPYSFLVPVTNVNQMLHWDGQLTFGNDLVWQPQVVGLQTLPPPFSRNSRLGLAKSLDVYNFYEKKGEFSRFTGFQENIFRQLDYAGAFLGENEELISLRNATRDRIEGIKKGLIQPNPWEVFLNFHSDEVTENLTNMLTQSPKLVHKHNYEPNQLVLLDNVRLVHGRLRNSDFSPGIPESELRTFQWNWRVDGLLQPVDYRYDLSTIDSSET